MVKIRPHYVLTIILLILGAANSLAESKRGNAPVFGNAGFEIPDSELPTLKHDALAGDGDAAWRLALYYDFAATDFNQHYYWVMIAAEDGNPSGEYSYGWMLTKQSDPIHKVDAITRLRGLFWLKRAKRDGVANATTLLKEIGQERP